MRQERNLTTGILASGGLVLTGVLSKLPLRIAISHPMAENKEDFERREDLTLPQAAQMLLDECRMVLPGIQALFGFQLIAVFSDGFTQRLTQGQQELHAVAIALVLLAIIMIMAPAAYHRMQGARQVTDTFINTSGVLLLMSMVPLALAITLDFYLILAIIFSGSVPIVGAAILLAGFMLLWFVLPRSNFYRSVRERRARKRHD